MKHSGTILFAAAFVANAAALAADPEHGLAVAEHWCDSCHVIHQKDPGWHSGNVAPRFSLLTHESYEEVRALLRKGHAGMAALSKIPDADVADIVAHIQRLKPEEQ
jgi:mono/diheme cytochrome c family protein